MFAFLRREVCFCIISVNQDCRAVMRESRFPLRGKMSKDKVIRLLRLGFDQLVIFLIEGHPRDGTIGPHMTFGPPPHAAAPQLVIGSDVQHQQLLI
jgi:hypothetical protein